MLTHASSLTVEERAKPPAPPPEDLLKQLKAAAAGLESRRSQIAAEVFQPSHNLPTRTLREQVCVTA